MDLPPTVDSPGGASSSPAESRASARLERLRVARQRLCADQAVEAREVAGLVEDCRSEVRERVLALGDTDVDMDAEEFAHRMCVDSVMCALGVGKTEATVLVNLADRLAMLPEVWDAWSTGVVLHADTLFNDGPAADATAQLRGLGRPDVVDPASARTLARRQLENGTSVQVLVVDDTGALQRVIRLDKDTAEHCRSRAALVAAVQEQLADAPSLDCDTHDPTEAIACHVRAAAPTCSFYDCPRQARSCDLDHDTPWPRGPTSVTNLDPKCRRHHNAKTSGVVKTRLVAGPGNGPRTVHWTLPAGVQVTTSPEPLPGVHRYPTPAAG